MGLISSFIGGAAKGANDASKMLMADKIAGERDEVNYLRSSALKKQITSEEREFKSSEAEKRDTAAMERTKYTADTKASKSGDTTNIKDADALISQGYPKDVANAVAHGALKQIKDEDTGDMVLVNALNNKPIGRLTTVGGKKTWMPEGDEPELADITSAHRKTAKKSASKKAGYFSTDETDFPSTGGDRKAWAKKEAQRLANEERASKKSGSIIGSKMKSSERPTASDLAYLKANPGKRAAFIKRFGEDALPKN